MAKTYKTRPSNLYDIQDPVAAWSFDRAVFLFGSTLEREIETAGAGAKNPRQANVRRQRVLAKWLGIQVKYADPATVSPSAPKPVSSDEAAGLVTL
jgi:hypothetical protein